MARISRPGEKQIVASFQKPIFFWVPVFRHSCGFGDRMVAARLARAGEFFGRPMRKKNPPWGAFFFLGVYYVIAEPLTSETCSAPGPSSVNDSPACLGRHPLSESVSSGSFDPAWLKCSFHFPIFLLSFSARCIFSGFSFRPILAHYNRIPYTYPMCRVKIEN